MRGDKRFMRVALRLARQGAGRAACEPRVGAVAVVDGQVVGKAHAGGRPPAPAALAALMQAGARAGEATLYTNAAPGCDAPDPEAALRQLLSLRPRRIVIGAPRPAGCDLDGLRAAGVEVEVDVCAADCLAINEAYFKFSETGLPFVTVKFAQSLDGRIATATQDSQWISGPAALRLAHRLRREHDAILVGVGTVLADDPRLTVRLVNGRDPLRVVVDSRLRTPATARVLGHVGDRPTLIAAADPAAADRRRALEAQGAEVVTLPGAATGAGIDLSVLLLELGRRRVASVLVEGGAGVITSLLLARRVDRLVVAIAPKIIGQGVEAVGDLGVRRLADALTLSQVTMRRLGDDLIIDGRLPAN